MAYTVRPETVDRLSDTVWHVITAIAAVAGIVAAAVGALMGYGPVDGVITMFGGTWNVSDLSEMWAPFLMMGGGLIAMLSMGIESIRDWGSEATTWLVTMEMLVAAAGAAALVVGIVLLF